MGDWFCQHFLTLIPSMCCTGALPGHCIYVCGQFCSDLRKGSSFQGLRWLYLYKSNFLKAGTIWVKAPLVDISLTKLFIWNKWFNFRNTGCEKLIKFATKSFISAGGQRSWIRDMKNVPEKLQRLSSISSILWTNPWSITQHNLKVSFQKLCLISSRF